MEILKFEDSGSTSPSRKRSGRGAILVAFVAIVFGASTALASGTLQINSGNGIELAQGVSQTTQCDPDGVSIALDSSLAADASKFFLHGITVSGIHDQCLNKNLRLKVYSSTGTQQTFCSIVTPDTGCVADITGTYVQGTVGDAPGTDDNELSFTFSQVLELATKDTAKNVTIETIS